MNTFDWSNYTGGIDWLPRRTLYLTRHGSHAYGTNLPSSDLDIRGICVAPLVYHVGFSKTFEQAVQHEPDLTIFELRKFLKLACDCNPNVLEILFTDPSDHLYVDPLMRPLLDARQMFVTTKAKHTFSGYAASQLKRIRAHYRWLKDPPKEQPMREQFGLPERTVIPSDQLAAAQAAIREQIDRWSWRELQDVEPAVRQALQDEFARKLSEIAGWSDADTERNTWTAAARAVGYDANFIRLLDLERQYTAKLREFQNYERWKKERNPARAELEAKYGYDCKHAMHLVRLMRMCREILTTGQVIVRRPDAEELLAIRNGAWPYEQLIEWAERTDAELEELVKVSTLPRQPDRDALDRLCAETILAMGPA